MITRLPVVLVKTVGILVSNPQLVARGLLPLVWGVITFAILVILSFFFNEEVAHLFSLQSDIYIWLTLLICIIASSFFSVVIVLLSSEFLMDRFIEKASNIIAIPQSYERHTFGVFELAKLLLIRIIILILLGIAGITAFIIPILHPIVWILGSFAFGSELIHTPATVIGVSLKKQRGFIGNHKIEITLLGALSSLSFLIPLAGLLFLPLAYLVGLQLIKEYLKEDDIST